MSRSKLPNPVSSPVAAGVLALLSFFGAGVAGASGLQTVPVQPRAGAPFVLDIAAQCCASPALIEDLSVSVSDGVIRVDTTRSCGPFAAFAWFDYSAVVPPVPPGEYRVEVWAHGRCAPDGEPELTETVTVAEVSSLADPSCTPGVEPAATLLFPYFEVDAGSANGVTTLLAVTNALAEPVLANVTLWSNWGFPVAAFEVYLGAADVQTLNLRDVLAGNLPVTGPGPGPAAPGFEGFPDCDPSNVAGAGFDPDFVLAALRGEADGGSCWGHPLPGGHATGFVTVDVVEECSDLLPSDDGYFATGGAGVAGDTNALLGDFFLVEPGEDFAQGESAVHVRADPGALGAGDPTFYGDLAGSGGNDARMPLGRVHSVRFLENPGFDGGTELLVWRDVSELSEVPVDCERSIQAGLPWLHAEASVEAFDEQGSRTFLAVSPDHPTFFPLATQRVAVGPLVPWDSGWLRMDLLDQSAVTAVMRGLGRFSIGVSSAQLDDPCAGLQ